MGTISDFEVKRKRSLGHWEGVLEEWILAIEKYARMSGGEAPYWYNERANIGLLAAAAWRTGGVALEEFQHEKSEPKISEDGETVETMTRNGRCDLWICLGTKSERIEAKFRWLNMASDRIAEFAEESLNKALNDASKSKCDDAQGAVGVSFFPIFVKANKVTVERPIENYIEQTIANLRKVDSDLIAWSFPIRFRSHVGEKYNNLLPGVVMLAKRVS